MILLALCLFSTISTSNFQYTQHELHTKAEKPKVCTLENGNVFVMTSSSTGNLQESQIALINKNNKIVYKEVPLEIGYTDSAQIVENRNENPKQNYIVFHHNKQATEGSLHYESITYFSDKAKNFETKNTKNSIYKKLSAVSLKNGYIVTAGVNPISTERAETSVEIRLHEPVRKTEGIGCSFEATNELISCFEQADNDVYCVYVHDDPLSLYSRIAMRHLAISGTQVQCGTEETIKVFYTSFNYLKAVRYNNEQALILFQAAASFDNTGLDIDGKDLFLYQIKTAGGLGVVRYDYLYNDCTNKKNPEYENADISVFQEKLIYAVCESNGILKGFAISKDIKKIERFDFDKHEKNMAYPVFAKFNKNLGLFYTDYTEQVTPKVKYFLINYPCCDDYSDGDEVLLPRYKTREIALGDSILFMNSYPPSKKEDKINSRFFETENVTILYEDKELPFNKDFDPDKSVKIQVGFKEGKYDIEYAATRIDPIEGLIRGRTCKISANSPKCLDQCYSCVKEGTEKEHNCLGCKQPNYYEVEVKTAQTIEPFGKWHNCERCNNSCYSCYGPFINTPERTTTNCKKCNYTYNYFPYEDDETICISTQTQDYWEREIFEVGIYLDKSGGDKKEDWIWRKCHPNCIKCDERGDDKNNKCTYCNKDLNFWCNQTTTNGGIPGSCHLKCYHNGFYLKEDEGRDKCCECIDNCKYCENDKTCDKCFKPFYVSLNQEKCVGDCDYCEAKYKKEDKNDIETPYNLCINCKTHKDFGSDFNTLNQTCVKGLVFPDKIDEKINRTHHILDEKCNLLIGCKDGCKNCTEWYSNKCVECNETHYKEDFFGLETPKTFHCYNKTTCQGLTGYELDEDEEPEESKVGGCPCY